MENLFITLLNMSINATYIIIAVVLFKLILRKSPRWIHCILWSLVSVRLVLPFSFKSKLSVLPTDKTIVTPVSEFNAQIGTKETFSDTIVYTPINIIEQTANNEKAFELTFTNLASIIWLIGVCLLFIYAIYSYLKIKLRVKPSINLYDNVYICDSIPSPFILGVFKPKIYIPSGTPTNDYEMILSHEKAHLKRGDHIWKPIAYILLSLYWFNPFLWIAYYLLSRDIEIACDEKVIKNLSLDEKKCYSTALLNSSVSKRFITVCPLAFGETGVKNRIKNVFNYKKPAFWIIAVSVVICGIVAACFLTNPVDKNSVELDSNISNINYFSDLEGISAEITKIDLVSDTPSVTVKYDSRFEKEVVFGDSYYVYKSENGEWVNCDRVKNDVWFAIGYPIVNGGFFEKTYSLTSHDLDESGEYKFETDFLVKNQTLNKDGSRKKYHIGFTFTLDTPVPYNEENISASYNFKDSIQLKFMNSPDPFIPCIRINRIDKTYMFTYSGYSSHVSIGQFDLFIDRLVLREFGNDNVYTFSRGVKGFEFVKAESSRLPKYSYREGESAQEPVPDGALFEWENSTDFLSIVYDIAQADLDKDGIEEEYTLSAGMTSGIFTFSLNVREDDYQNSGTFCSEWVNPRFFLKDDELKISATTQEGTVFIWTVEYDGESLNIPELFREANPPSTAKVNYGYITEVGDGNEYIIVSEGNDGYIHTNKTEFAANDLFKFYTNSQKTSFEIGNKVRIVHTGEFTYEDLNDDIPVGEPISIIDIVE